MTACTDDERRRVASARLRELRPGACFDDVYEALGAYGPSPYASRVLSATGFARLLADLIDPTCVAHRDQLFYPATDLTPEHEETIYRCGSCYEIVSYDEDYDPETDAPAYCEMCGSRITGIGEPWDE